MNERRALAAIFLMWAIGLCSVAGAQTVRYVSATGSDSSDCAAQGAPCRTIQYAVSRSATADEIRVAEGRYGDLWRNGADWGIVDIDRSLTAKGGFGAGDWTVSDPVLHPTVLDAGFQ